MAGNPEQAARHVVRTVTFLEKLAAWAHFRDDIRALLLVGSFARGNAWPDSDVDVMLLVVEPVRYLEDTAWVEEFGELKTVLIEEYGRCTSVRVVYSDGLEVEFGVTDARWAASPFDSGTELVARDGILVVLDRDGEATMLARAVGSHHH